MASRGGFGFHQEVPSVAWEVQGVRGADQDIADVTAEAFGRRLSFGEALQHSPADGGRLLERPSCSEVGDLGGGRTGRSYRKKYRN